MKKRKVLFVDDEEVNLMVAEATLSKYFDIYTANSGEEGLQMIRSNEDLNCIVSDVKMPEMDGLSFIQTALKERPDLCCFLLSGFHETKEIAEAIKRDEIKRYFQKPMIKDAIVNSIETCC